MKLNRGVALMDQRRDTNRRQFFRIQVDNEPCRLQILSIDGQTVSVTKEMLGQIIDISAAGLLFQGPLDLPGDRKIGVKAFFRLQGESFALEATIVRKIAHENEFRYGLRFENLLESDRERILIVLGKLQVKLRSKRK